ncbi:MAG: glycosyltransferase family 4 protein [Candidatus Methanoperedens sp.]|nr:glycosyltransferase family 4 protein [Candidatus Methanoperedens sp.]
MKIAQVCPRYYPDIGGVETYVQEISERLVKRGFNVDVVCTDPTGQLPEQEVIKGVTIKRFRSFAPGDAYYFAPQIYFYLRDHHYDLIHAHSYHAFPALFAALAMNKSRLIFTPYYHGGGHTHFRNLLLKPYRLLGSKIFEKSDKVTCISEYERSKVISDFGVPLAKIEKIPIGLNLEEFEKHKYQKKNKGGKTLLYVGRLEEYKGIHHIIKTLPCLAGFKLEVIGKGPYEKRLHELAEELSVTKQINWYKNMTREKLLHYYASADIFLMLSTHESYGITVAEALLAGTPCIVTTGSALEEFVDGRLCLGIEKPITSNKLILAIKQLYESGIKDTMENINIQILNWDEVTDKLINVYKHTL